MGMLRLPDCTLPLMKTTRSERRIRLMGLMLRTAVDCRRSRGTVYMKSTGQRYRLIRESWQVHQWCHGMNSDLALLRVRLFDGFVLHSWSRIPLWRSYLCCQILPYLRPLWSENSKVVSTDRFFRLPRHQIQPHWKIRDRFHAIRLP